MADEILDLDQLDTDLEKENRIEKRIKDLSEKVRLTSEERDEKSHLLEEKDSKISTLEKERDFLNLFGDQVGKYPEASQFKDKIKERVLKGYSVEDATTAVLVAEGKYNPPQPPPPSIDSFAGGSATTQHQTGGEKPLNQLTRDEKRAKLIEAEQRGDLSVT